MLPKWIAGITVPASGPELLQSPMCAPACVRWVSGTKPSARAVSGRVSAAAKAIEVCRIRMPASVLPSSAEAGLMRLAQSLAEDVDGLVAERAAELVEHAALLRVEIDDDR